MERGVRDVPFAVESSWRVSRAEPDGVLGRANLEAREGEVGGVLVLEEIAEPRPGGVRRVGKLGPQGIDVDALDGVGERLIDDGPATNVGGA